MEDVFADVDARPKRRQGVTGQTIEAQMRGTMCQISEYELDMLRDEITRLRARLEQAERGMREAESKAIEWHKMWLKASTQGFRAGIEAAAERIESIGFSAGLIRALAEQNEDE